MSVKGYMSTDEKDGFRVWVEDKETGYTNWLNENPNIVYEFAASLMYTLPGKRQEFYSNPSF